MKYLNVDEKKLSLSTESR